jgi:outer membrane protein TolC
MIFAEISKCWRAMIVKNRRRCFSFRGKRFTLDEVIENDEAKSQVNASKDARLTRFSHAMFRRCSAIFFCAALLLSACSTKHYRESADKEVAAAIKQKTSAVPNMVTNFSIEPVPRPELENLPVAKGGEEFFGPGGDKEKGAKIISLKNALEIATKESRDYQAEKEKLYAEALSLTLARHAFAPIFSVGGSTKSDITHGDVAAGVDSMVEEHDADFKSSWGVDMLLRTGGKVAAAFSTDFFRYLSGNPRVVTSSELVGTFTQPLLRGAGYKVTMENLTQAERNLLYRMRDFTRYRKDFSVKIATDYYTVLQNRDTVRNSWRGFQNFKANVEQERAFTEEGLRPQASLDQIKQAALKTEATWVNAVRRYRESLDSFKIELGLSLDENVILDDAELENLKILHPKIDADEAAKVALTTRLDLYNQRDEAQDAVRKIDIAANGLKTQLDLNAGVTVPQANRSGLVGPDFNHYYWDLGLNLDLPLDRKRERNQYRLALIANDKAVRDLSLAVDNIKLEINNDWRSLDQAKRNFEISELGVQLAERRVEEQQLRAELGIGTARDLVDAQTDLISSKNERTSALVSHTIARLNFWRDMGILMIKDDGQWEEISDAKTIH